MQFNFGDVSDDQRGVVLYEPDTDTLVHQKNPHGVIFQQMSPDALKVRCACLVCAAVW